MGRPGTWGEDGTREVTSPSTWKKPLAWAKNARTGLLPDGTPNLDGHRPRVFCASLADVFEDRPEVVEARYALFDLIRKTPELDWLLLTKRPEFAGEWLTAYYDTTEEFSLGLLDVTEFPLPNVWMGVSIENARHTYRADVLREIPAAVRFISAEPLIGSLFQDRGLPDTPGRVTGSNAAQSGDGEDASGHAPERSRSPLDLTGIDWCIVGGESGGRDARPMHPNWAREIRDACLGEDYVGPGEVDRVGPKLHFKQWGSYAPRGFVSGLNDVDARPEKSVDGFRMFYYGTAPKSAGKILDGKTWCEFPDSNLLVPA